MSLLMSTPQEREEAKDKMTKRASAADSLVTSTVSTPQNESQKDSGDFLMTSC